MLQRPWLAALLVAAAACSSGPTGSDEPITTVDQAEVRWRESGITTYRFISDPQCFCAEGKLRVEVLRGVVVRVVRLSTGKAEPPRFQMPIDSLFAFIRREQRRLPERLRVTYDEVLGYPRSVAYGTPENDGGGVIRIENLRRVP